jgi:small-conductance mechanosensitive channel
MSYGQAESNNNAKFDELSSRLSTFRNITQDIHNVARDDSIIDQLNEQVGRLYDNIKDSSQGLRRSMQSGNSIWRYVGLSLLAFFIIWLLFRFI